MYLEETPHNCWTCKRREKNCYFMDRFRDASALHNLIKAVYPDVAKKDQYLICEHWVRHRKERVKNK